MTVSLLNIGHVDATGVTAELMTDSPYVNLLTESVTFGDIPSRGLPSSQGGTQITFWVPKEAPSTGEAPPRILEPGRYPVTVTTTRGTSEPVMFTLIEAG